MTGPGLGGSRWGLGLAALAGLAGAAGVTLAAIAAHRLNNPSLLAASNMLQVHAVAALALVALSMFAHVRSAWLVAASLMLAGSGLFATAVSMQVMAATSLFPMAAPIGGSAVIAGWLAVIVSAVIALRSNPSR